VLRQGLHVQSMRGNGEKIDIRVDLSMTPIRGAGGEVLGIFGISADRQRPDGAGERHIRATGQAKMRRRRDVRLYEGRSRRLTIQLCRCLRSSLVFSWACGASPMRSPRARW